MKQENDKELTTESHDKYRVRPDLLLDYISMQNEYFRLIYADNNPPYYVRARVCDILRGMEWELPADLIKSVEEFFFHILTQNRADD